MPGPGRQPPGVGAVTVVGVVDVVGVLEVVEAAGAGPGRLLVDDVLATGGTMRACCDLVRRTGAEIVGCAFLIELTFLSGRSKLAPDDVFSLLSY